MVAQVFRRKEPTMSNPDYGLTRELPDVSYEDAVTRTTEALKTEGFGVLTEIDIKATLKKKLDVDFRKYVILGACNPKLAHQALSGEQLIGLLLPCNVVILEGDDGGSIVSAINPERVFGLVEDDSLAPIAKQVKEKLSRALENL